MHSITRRPRLLLRMAVAPKRANLAVGGLPIEARFERLFSSIKPANPQGVSRPAQWHVMTSSSVEAEVNAWDLCHHIVAKGLGFVGSPTPEFAEPDLEQRWIFGSDRDHALAAARPCDKPSGIDGRVPSGTGFFWFRDASHSQLEAARTTVGDPGGEDRVRIAHLDTGFDPKHSTKPKHLLTNLARNYVDEDAPDDATDRTSGLLTNLGHGTGTLSILAGANVNGSPLGGAPNAGIVPIRIANAVALFRNSAIARAFDYTHQLYGDPRTRVHVVTMSMGGLASQAWAEAVNALYDLGVFIVTAAGNNFGNLPTHHIVYPARFGRVVAACGVMADGHPYADLPMNIMAGNYGPDRKMGTAIAAFTPNTPWARFGCPDTVDHDGRGTSAATPQIAAAAALWIQRYKKRWEAFSEGWMRVEAVRRALFDSAHLAAPELHDRLGRGIIQARAALERQPSAATALRNVDVDSADFPFLRVLTGLGLAAVPDARQSMLELELLQLTQVSHELARLLPDPHADLQRVSAADRQRFIDAAIATPGASETLKEVLGRHSSGVSGAQRPRGPSLAGPDHERLERAVNPPLPAPVARRLRTFAFDPLLGTRVETLDLNETTLEVRWERELGPGPVGEYVEVVDIDPATGVCYAPIDLNDPFVLAQSGLTPAESRPQFHQQMVYAVGMKTIEHFEHALGRVALWAPRVVTRKGDYEEHYVRRLRIYPHAMREANSYYSPEKKALLLGYFFPPPTASPNEDYPGGAVFCALSHDVIAHETTHALLDGLHRRFREPSNPDVLAFHEAFADIVALFQHFTVPEALRGQIAATRGDLGKENLLGQLAQQFGQAIGQYGALRSAIGQEKNGRWEPAEPTRRDYETAIEPHDRGAVLVAAVFNAFLEIYRRRSADLIRLATGGTGILADGAIPHDLVIRLADEASKTAGHILNICIRALDYCPPVDLTYGDYLRALITADRDLVPDDPLGYRAAFSHAFRRRGIFPENVRTISPDSLCWEQPETRLPLANILKEMSLGWDLHADRRKAFHASTKNAALLHEWLANQAPDSATAALGFYRLGGRSLTIEGRTGTLSNFEVHSVRPARRIGPDGQQRVDLIVEITQTWRSSRELGTRYRGGCTLVIDLETQRIRYCARKRVANPRRIATHDAYGRAMAAFSLRGNYFDDVSATAEPFAVLHRGL